MRVEDIGFSGSRAHVAHSLGGGSAVEQLILEAHQGSGLRKWVSRVCRTKSSTFVFAY